MGTETFYKHQSLQSRVKTKILCAYFEKWAQIIKVTKQKHKKINSKIIYMDLFCGPGRYDDDNLSTPLLILEKASKDHEIMRGLLCYFNDKDNIAIKKLENEISALYPDIPNNPIYTSMDVGEEIVQHLNTKPLSCPSLCFIDPWGYKGLSLDLIGASIKGWGSDTVFFFNYNRIRPGIENHVVKKHMEALFGEKRFSMLREVLSKKNIRSKKAEKLIICQMREALKENSGCNYILPFCFKDDHGQKTSHHLIFVTKNFKGYDVMKEIMAKESSRHIEGVPSFCFNPCDLSSPNDQLNLFCTPIDDLKEDLLVTFEGETLSMQNIYERHTLDTNYIRKNYKKALNELYKENRISTPQKKPRGETFADDIIVCFP